MGASSKTRRDFLKQASLGTSLALSGIAGSSAASAARRPGASGIAVHSGMQKLAQVDVLHKAAISRKVAGLRPLGVIKG